MKKAKKILTLALCLLVLFATLAVAHAIDERGVELPSCPECEIGGMVQKTRTRTLNNVHYPCVHDLDGSDVYRVKQEANYSECDTCSYKAGYNDWEVVSEVFLRCEGTVLK